MLIRDDKIYRNLQEQVLQNQRDIQTIFEEAGVLNEFGIKVVGVIENDTLLPDPVTYVGEFGDAYAIGEDTPYELWIYTRANQTHLNNWWFNIGLFPGPSTVPGPIGPQGIQGETGTRGSQWNSQTGAPTNTISVLDKDQALDTLTGNVYQYSTETNKWEFTGNIRGPQGLQGEVGPIGPQGIQGETGPVGPTGNAGEPFRIVGTLANTNQLPMPDSVPLNYAYLIEGDDNAEHIWVIIGDGTASNSYKWHDAGSFGGGTTITIDGAKQANLDLSYISKTPYNYEIGENTQVSANGSEITFSNLQAIGTDLNDQPIDSVASIELPIASSSEVEIVVDNNVIKFDLTSQVWNEVQSMIDGSGPEEVQINAPSTSTNGQLDATQLAKLQANKGTYLMFNNEIYRLQDVQHISGYLVYTHIGYNNTTSVYTIKCITITLNTRGWVLTSRTIMNPASYSTTAQMNTAINNATSGKINRSGDAMTGPLVLRSVQSIDSSTITLNRDYLYVIISVSEDNVVFQEFPNIQIFPAQIGWLSFRNGIWYGWDREDGSEAPLSSSNTYTITGKAIIIPTSF